MGINVPWFHTALSVLVLCVWLAPLFLGVWAVGAQPSPVQRWKAVQATASPLSLLTAPAQILTVQLWRNDLQTINTISLCVCWGGSSSSCQDSHGVISFLKRERPRPILSLTSYRCLVKVTSTAIVITFFFFRSSLRKQIASLPETYGHLHVSVLVGLSSGGG